MSHAMTPSSSCIVPLLVKRILVNFVGRKETGRLGVGNIDFQEHRVQGTILKSDEYCVVILVSGQSTV